MKLILKQENNLKSWAWRSLLGPSSIVDGVVETLTLSTFNFNLKYKIATKLAKSRYNHNKSLNSTID